MASISGSDSFLKDFFTKCLIFSHSNSNSQSSIFNEATNILLNGLDGEPLGDPKYIKFQTGVRKESWNKNVIAMGLAAGFMEPLESTSIHLIQTAVARVMANFPDKYFNQADIDYYNQRTLLEFEQVRDFLVLHYCVTERDDSDFWNYVRTMKIPETLQQRIDIFNENARVYRHDNELFGDISWLAVMHGQGLTPKRYHPTVNMMPEEELNRRMFDIHKTWKACLDQMPTHQQFIDQNCKAV